MKRRWPLLAVYDCVYQTDHTSAFGGIIAFNRPLDAETAKAIVSRQFVEVIIAPAVDDDALTVLTGKQNVRVLACGCWQQQTTGLDFKRVNGGLLVQERDVGMVDLRYVQVVTERHPTEAEMRDALFCCLRWRNSSNLTQSFMPAISAPSVSVQGKLAAFTRQKSPTSRRRTKVCTSRDRR